MTKSKSDPNRSSMLRLLVLCSLFFFWGSVGVLVDLTVPIIKSRFDLFYWQALLIQSSYFLAYLFLGRASGQIVATIGYTKGLLIGLALMIVGASSLAITASTGFFYPILPSFFVIASGVTFLQVAANPLAAGFGDATASSRRLSAVQGFNSLGTFIAPLAISVMLASADMSAPETGVAVVRTAYLSIAALLILLSGLVWIVFRSVHDLTQQKQTDSVARSGKGLPAKVFFGMLAIFLYVGAEVSIGSTLVNHLEAENIVSMSRDRATAFLSLYWGGALLGRFVGAAIMHRVPSWFLLMVCSSIAATLCGLATISTGWMAAALILGVGLFNSIQFPTIFALSIHGLDSAARAQASGWLCTGIVGGGIVPLCFGLVSDIATLSAAYAVPAMCYIYIAVFARAQRGEAKI